DLRRLEVAERLSIRRGLDLSQPSEQEVLDVVLVENERDPRAWTGKGHLARLDLDEVERPLREQALECRLHGRGSQTADVVRARGKQRGGLGATFGTRCGWMGHELNRLKDGSGTVGCRTYVSGAGAEGQE